MGNVFSTTAGPKDRAGLTLHPVYGVPTNINTNSESPIPTGAKNVPLCFSTANYFSVCQRMKVFTIRMVKINSAVRNISKKSPRDVLIPSNISRARCQENTAKVCGYIHGPWEKGRTHGGCDNSSDDLRNGGKYGSVINQFRIR